MYTMVVQMSTDASRVEQVARHLREDVVEFAKQQPGFVSGQWLRSADGGKAMGVVVFASEEAATSATQGSAQPAPRRRAGLEHRERHGLRTTHLGLTPQPPRCGPLRPPRTVTRPLLARTSTSGRQAARRP
jgi:hypothetical protein